MSRATSMERIIAKGQLIPLVFVQDKVAAGQSAVAMNLVEVSAAQTAVALLDGAAAGDHTLAAITTADTIAFVGHISTKADVATIADLTSEFSVAAGKVTNAAGTDTTNDQLLVIWRDADATVATTAVQGIPIPWEFEILGASIESTEARTAGSVVADVTIDGTVTGLQTTLDASNTTRHTIKQSRGSDVGAAGSRVGVKLTTASWTPVTADIAVTVWVLAHLEGV